MRMTRHDPVERDQMRWTLTIDGGEFVRAPLDGFDRALLRDCGSPDATIADVLLALETVARRIEQADQA